MSERNERRCTPAVCAVVLMASWAGPATAQVEEYEFIKGVAYRQTSNNTQPVAPEMWYIDSFIGTGDPSDISAADIDGTYDYQFYDPTEWDLLFLYGSEAAWNAAFPDNTAYTMNITAGLLSPGSQAFTLGPEHIRPTAIPYLTGDSFADLQGMNAAAPVSLTWNSAASAGAGLSAISVFAGDDEVFTMIFGPDETATVIAGGTLVAGVTYEMEVIYANATFPDADPSGFDAPGLIVGERLTFVAFTTAGGICPCEFGGTGEMIDVSDLLGFLSLWFPQNGAAPPAGPGTGADFDGSDLVDVSDLLAFLGCWFPASGGDPCP